MTGGGDGELAAVVAVVVTERDGDGKVCVVVVDSHVGQAAENAAPIEQSEACQTVVRRHEMSPAGSRG